jgi:hypothetical protein
VFAFFILKRRLETTTKKKTIMNTAFWLVRTNNGVEIRGVEPQGSIQSPPAYVLYKLLSDSLPPGSIHSLVLDALYQVMSDIGGPDVDENHAGHPRPEEVHDTPTPSFSPFSPSWGDFPIDPDEERALLSSFADQAFDPMVENVVDWVGNISGIPDHYGQPALDDEVGAVSRFNAGTPARVSHKHQPKTPNL